MKFTFEILKGKLVGITDAEGNSGYIVSNNYDGYGSIVHNLDYQLKSTDLLHHCVIFTPTVDMGPPV